MRSIFVGIGSRAARIVNEILRNSRDPLSPGDVFPLDINVRKGEKPYEAEVEVTKEGARISPRKAERGEYHYMVGPGDYSIHMKMPEGDIWKMEEIKEKGRKIEVSVAEAKPPKPPRFSRELKAMVVGKLTGLIPIVMNIGALPYCLLIVGMGILPEIAADKVKVDGTPKKGGFLALVGAVGLAIGWFACYMALPAGGIAVPSEVAYIGALSVLSAMLGEVAAYIYLLLTRPVEVVPVLREFYAILRLIAMMFLGSLLGGLIGAIIIWFMHIGGLGDIQVALGSLFIYSLISFFTAVLIALAVYKLWRYNLRRFWKSATFGAMSFLIMLAAALYLSLYTLIFLKAVPKLPFPYGLLIPSLDLIVIPSLALIIASVLGYHYFTKIRPVIDVLQRDIPSPRIPSRSYKGEVVAMVLQQQDQPLDCIDVQEREAKELGISLKYIIPQPSEIPRLIRDVASSMKLLKRAIWERTGRPLDAVFVLMDMEVRERVDTEDPAVLSSLWLSSAVSDVVGVPSILILVLPERPVKEAAPALSCAPAEGLAPLDPSFRDYVKKQLECYNGLILIDPAYLAPGTMGVVEGILRDEIVRRICPLLEPGSVNVISASGVDSQHVIKGIQGPSANKRAKGVSIVGFSSTEMPKYDRSIVSMLVRESISNTTAKVDLKDVGGIFMLARGDRDLISLSDIYYSVKALFRGAVSAFDVETGQKGYLEMISILSGISPDSLPIWGVERPVDREIEEEKRELRRKVEEKTEEINRSLPEMGEEEKRKILEKLREEIRRIEEIAKKPEEVKEKKAEEIEEKKVEKVEEEKAEKVEERKVEIKPIEEAEIPVREIEVERPPAQRIDFRKVDADKLERIIIG